MGGKSRTHREEKRTAKAREREEKGGHDWAILLRNEREGEGFDTYEIRWRWAGWGQLTTASQTASFVQSDIHHQHYAAIPKESSFEYPGIAEHFPIYVQRPREQSNADAVSEGGHLIYQKD